MKEQLIEGSRQHVDDDKKINKCINGGINEKKSLDVVSLLQYKNKKANRENNNIVKRKNIL